MTPRLRNLLIGLGISVAIMIFDQFSKSSGSSSSKPTRKAKIQQPKKDTAPSTALANSTPKPKKTNSMSSSRRRASISSQLVGWQRNPFNAVAKSSEADIDGTSISTEEDRYLLSSLNFVLFMIVHGLTKFKIMREIITLKIY